MDRKKKMLESLLLASMFGGMPEGMMPGEMPGGMFGFKGPNEPTRLKTMDEVRADALMAGKDAELSHVYEVCEGFSQMLADANSKTEKLGHRIEILDAKLASAYASLEGKDEQLYDANLNCERVIEQCNAYETALAKITIDRDQKGELLNHIMATLDKFRDDHPAEPIERIWEILGMNKAPETAAAPAENVAADEMLAGDSDATLATGVTEVSGDGLGDGSHTADDADVHLTDGGDDDVPSPTPAPEVAESASAQES